MTITEDSFQVAICGGGGVGKSSITVMFVMKLFDEEYNPTIEDAYKRTIQVDGINCNLSILDTAGQDEYEALRAGYMRASQAFLFVYDLTDERSIENLEQYIEQIRRAKDMEDFPVVLCGNKCDMGVVHPDVEKKARDMVSRLHNCPHLLTSAKTKHNIDEAFTQVVREFRRFTPEKDPTPTTTRKGLFSSVSDSKTAKSDLNHVKNIL